MASTQAPNNPETLAHVQKFWEARKPRSPIYQFLLDDIQLTHASKGVVRARLLLTSNHVNTHGGIHGSVSATLIDWVGGIAIAAWDNRDKAGVSTDIHISHTGIYYGHDMEARRWSAWAGRCYREPHQVFEGVEEENTPSSLRSRPRSMDDRTPLGLRRLTALELDASATAVRLWGLNGDSAYITRYKNTSFINIVSHLANALITAPSPLVAVCPKE
ncbi:hypothetical protein OPT61_g5256 [Boeremia exigua]|uniref:Uncharacterized protein n=1 Tax=Boeremia exigua TaxID=749465 RepID=A0ACC2IAW5_9PLEO|nr:hypothetical protein OPT61_g5256 [Boeremia exigua]